MMASEKTNYVVNYITLDVSDIVNQSQNLPIYEVLTPSKTQVNSTVSSGITFENQSINNNHCEMINILDGIIFSNSTQEVENSSNNEYESSGDESVKSKNIEEDDDLADLTNLNWLTELKNITNLPPTTQDVLEKPCDPPSQRFDKFIAQVNKMKENYNKKRDLYETMATEKPPFNYAQIIGMALLDEGRMTLKQICDWIEKRFAYYKFHKNWNNSIRHNLSLNFFFTKVARDKNEKGKGGYWELAVDMHKTTRKRIRHRRKKVGDLNRVSNTLIRNGRLLRSRINSKKHNATTKSVESRNVSDFISSLSNINDDSISSNEDQSGTEIIEEQQNINNILDDNQNTIIIPNPVLYAENPNVIVEAIPTYHFNQFVGHIENFDDNELNNLICMNDQELIDDFLNGNEFL